MPKLESIQLVLDYDSNENLGERWVDDVEYDSDDEEAKYLAWERFAAHQAQHPIVYDGPNEDMNLLIESLATASELKKLILEIHRSKVDLELEKMAFVRKLNSFQLFTKFWEPFWIEVFKVCLLASSNSTILIILFFSFLSIGVH